ncbi:MAG: type II toxin-antitoxin system YoeB family toxin [Lachnospiraceae bacterium]|nr:type II toxin-antitoxin system YoeB family toxin [Lachnospiraceae bacterium]
MKKFGLMRHGRIDDVNRLVYRINGNVMEIVSCKGHYDD